jgi:hypothetical protein
MIEIRIGYNEYNRESIKRLAPMNAKLNKMKTFIQINENLFIGSKDVNNVELQDKKYALYYNRIDDALVARFI